MTGPQAADPNHSSEKAATVQLSGSGTDPSMVSAAELKAAERAKGRAVAIEARDNLARQVTAIATAINEAQQELAEAEVNFASTPLAGAEREKARVLRDGVRKRIAALQEDYADGQKRLAKKDQLLQLDAIQKALTTRRDAAGAGATVAAEMRKAIARLAELLHRFRLLREEHRQATDMVRSLDPESKELGLTFSFAASVDQGFETSVTNAVLECQRIERELRKRAEQGATS